MRFERTREVLNYPLTSEEENAFFTYLETINHPHVDDIRVFYNITRSRFMDAYELNNRASLKRFSTKGSLWEKQATFRDTFIAAYKDLMPEVSHKLLSVCQKEKASGLWLEGGNKRSTIKTKTLIQFLLQCQNQSPCQFLFTILKNR